MSAFRVGAPELHQVVVVFSDITAPRPQQESLQEREERLRLAGRHGKLIEVLRESDERTIYLRQYGEQSAPLAQEPGRRSAR